MSYRKGSLNQGLGLQKLMRNAEHHTMSLNFVSIIDRSAS